MNCTIAQPTSASATSASGRLGASAASTITTPNSAAAFVSAGRPVEPRVATHSPPPTAPAPIAAVISPKPSAPASSGPFASTGSVTWNSYVSTPATAIISSGTASCGSPAT